MPSTLLIGDRLYSVSSSGLKKANDIPGFNELTYKDPLLGIGKNALMFYKKFSSPRKVFFRYNDKTYSVVSDFIEEIIEDEYSYDEIISYVTSPGEDTEINEFSIQTDIDEAILISKNTGDYRSRDIVLIPVFMNKEDILKSLVIIYPFGNLYDGLTCCWGTEENGTIHSLAEWFDAVHNNDLEFGTSQFSAEQHFAEDLINNYEGKDMNFPGLYYENYVMEWIVKGINTMVSNTLKLFKGVSKEEAYKIHDNLNSDDRIIVPSLLKNFFE